MKRARERDRGSVLTIVAVSLAALVATTAITVDLGRLMNRRRELQLVADVAALDASRTLTDHEPVSVQLERARVAAQRSASRNGLEDPDGLVVQLGRALPGGDLDVLAPSSPLVPDAVLVEARDQIDWLLAPGTGATSRSAVATSTAPPARATVAAGSGLAQLPTFRSSLELLLGEELALDAISYQGLLQSRIGVLDLAGQAGLLPAELLEQPLGVDQLVGMIADVVAAGGGSAEEVSALVTLAELESRVAARTDLPPVTLGELLDVDAASLIPATDLALDAASLVSGILHLSRHGQLLTVPELEIAVPGVASIDATAAVVEPPQFARGPAGVTVRTAQVRVQAELELALLGISLRLPLVVEAAGASATLLDVACSGGTVDHLTLDVRTDLARVAVGRVPAGELGDDGPVAISPGELALLGLGVPVTAELAVPRHEEAVQIPADELGQWTRVGGVPSLAGLGSVVSDAVADLPLLGVLLGALVAPLGDAVGATLDLLVQPLLEALGVSLGYVDVTAFDADCSRPRAPRLLR